MILKVFAEHLSKTAREADLAARLGGDEFLLLLTECDSEQVPVFLRRLKSIEIEWAGQKIPISFSTGWKEYELGEQPEHLLQEADKALYQDKQARRNPSVSSSVG